MNYIKNQQERKNNCIRLRERSSRELTNVKYYTETSIMHLLIECFCRHCGGQFLNCRSRRCSSLIALRARHSISYSFQKFSEAIRPRLSGLGLP